MPQAIDRKDVQRLIGEGAQVVEVLPKEEFEEDHLPGAISLPLDHAWRFSLLRGARPPANRAFRLRSRTPA